MSGKDSVIIGCHHCGAKNRVPMSRLGERAICGKCKSPLSAENRFPDHPVSVSDQTFKREVIDFPGPAVVYFWAQWCGYCQGLTPVINQLASQYAGRVKFVKLVLDQNPVTSSKYAVQSVPTLILFKRGSMVNRVMGAVPKQEIERQLQALL